MKTPTDPLCTEDAISTKTILRLVAFIFLIWTVTASHAAAAVLFNDDFNRSSGLGANWQLYAGAFSADGANALSTGTANFAGVTPKLGTNDYSVESVIIVPAGSHFSGVVARGNTATGFVSDLYSAQLDTSGKVSLYRRNARNWTLLKSASAVITAGKSYTLKLNVSGSSPVNLEVSFNGSILFAYADSSASKITSGIPGIENYNSGVKYDRFTVSGIGPAPRLSITPSTLAFTAVSGGALPPSQSLTISNSGGGTLTWFASDDAFWIDENPTSGTAPSIARVSVNTANLSPGTYKGTITVSASGAQGSPATIPVSYTISTPVFQDDFNQTDSSDLGSNWNEYLPSLGIVSARAVNLNANSHEARILTALGPDQDISVECGVKGPGSSCGPVARWSDKNNYYHARLDVGQQNIRLFKKVGGNNIALGTAPHCLLPETLYRLRLVVLHDQVSLFFGHEPNPAISVIDSSLPQGDFAGVHSFGAAPQTVAFDNFTTAPRAGLTTIERADIGLPCAEANGTAGAAESFLSGDGRYVAFESDASNLIPNDTNNLRDIFIYDTQTGQTLRASIGLGGEQANGPSFGPKLSVDGRFITFESDASNLVPGDTNSARDIFVYNIATGETLRANVSSTGEEAEPGSYSSYGFLNVDGRFATFYSDAANLAPNATNGIQHVFVRDMKLNTTTLISVDSNGVQGNGPSYCPSISDDGQLVAYISRADNLVPNDTNNGDDIFLYDMRSRTTARVSVSSAGAQGNNHYYDADAKISGDGRFVAFDSTATNLTAGGTTAVSNMFVHNIQTGATTLESVSSSGAQGNGLSKDARISSDGRFIAFESDATNLVVNDTNGVRDVFVRDRLNGVTTRMSVDANGVQGNASAQNVRVSGDGRIISFDSNGANLVPGDKNGLSDIFISPVPQ